MRRENKIFLSVLLTSFMGPFLGSSLNVAIPTMAKDFATSPAALSWLLSIYLMASVALLLPFGRAADLYGRRRMYACGTFLMAAFSAFAAFIPTLSMLLFLRALQGLSLGMVFASGMALLVEVSPKEQRGRVIGYSAAATYLGLSMGPPLGGLLTQLWGWQPIFLFAAGVVFIAACLAHSAREKSERRKIFSREAFPYRESCYYTAASVCTLYGLTALTENFFARILFAFGLLFFLLFLRVERRASNPLAPLALFRDKVFLLSNLAALLNYCATYAVSFLLSLYLQVTRGMTPMGAGLVLFLQPLIMAISSPLAGAWSDKKDARLIATLGMALTTAGIFCLSFVSQTTARGYILTILVIVGAGFGIFSPSNNNAIMGCAPKPLYGAASSMVAAMRLLGQAFSMALVAAIFVGLTGAKAPVAAMLTAIQIAFFALFLLSLWGAVISLLAYGRGRYKAQRK